MGNPIKYIEHGALYLVTSRTEEGLPFADELRFKIIIESVLARAQSLYPTEITCYDFEPNHFHMLLIPIDPDDFHRFVGYVKQELAHAVNRINGRRKKTIWCDGYDSPILLGYEEAIHYIAYCYTQSQKAHSVDTIDNKLGANSWYQFITGIYEKTCPRIYRTQYPKTKDLDVKSIKEKHSLIISPYAWLNRLAPEKNESDVKEEILRRVREIETICRDERKINKIPITSKISQSKIDSYIPKKFGKRMVCICWDIAKRISFLTWIKKQLWLCKDAFKSWKRGDMSIPWPIGFYPPSSPRVISLLPVSPSY